MEIKVVERHREWGAELRDHAIAKVQHLSHYYDGIISVDIVFDLAGERQSCELIAHLARKKIVKAREESAEIYAAIDGATAKLKRQLRRYKSRLRDNKRVREPVALAAEPGPEDGATELAPRIRRTPLSLSKPMTPEEAILKLDSSSGVFLLFLDAERQKLSVLWRLDDGNYELIEPEY